jgi:hypothetical protein
VEEAEPFRRAVRDWLARTGEAGPTAGRPPAPPPTASPAGRSP